MLEYPYLGGFAAGILSLPSISCKKYVINTINSVLNHVFCFFSSPQGTLKCSKFTNGSFLPVIINSPYAISWDAFFTLQSEDDHGFGFRALHKSMMIKAVEFLLNLSLPPAFGFQCFLCSLHSIAVLTVAMLAGIVNEWCANQSLRAHVRKHKCLFRPAPGDEKPKCSLKCLEENEGILTPLVHRMRGENGDIMIHTVPMLTKEKLASALRKPIFCFQNFAVAAVSDYFN